MQDYGLDIYLFQVWDDVRLAHDKERERQFYLSGNDIKKIWTPDTYFMNAKQTDIKDVSFNIVTIFHLFCFYFPQSLDCPHRFPWTVRSEVASLRFSSSKVINLALRTSPLAFGLGR